MLVASTNGYKCMYMGIVCCSNYKKALKGRDKLGTRLPYYNNCHLDVSCGTGQTLDVITEGFDNNIERYAYFYRGLLLSRGRTRTTDCKQIIGKFLFCFQFNVFNRHSPVRPTETEAPQMPTNATAMSRVSLANIFYNKNIQIYFC